MHQHPMAAYESQMAAQRSLMADAGLGINAAQPDALMHHQLAMAQNPNRKCLLQLSLLSRWPSLLSVPNLIMIGSIGRFRQHLN